MPPIPPVSSVAVAGTYQYTSPVLGSLNLPVSGGGNEAEKALIVAGLVTGNFEPLRFYSLAMGTASAVCSVEYTFDVTLGGTRPAYTAHIHVALGGQRAGLGLEEWPTMGGAWAGLTHDETVASVRAYLRERYKNLQDSGVLEMVVRRVGELWLLGVAVGPATAAAAAAPP